jgi:bifunctional non-homologous end joining protein LigD
MLATTHEGPADDLLRHPRWVFEPKFDGMRVLASIEPAEPTARVQLWTRNGREKTAQFPEIVKDLKRFARTLRRAVLVDGEIVALDARGRPQGFQKLAGRIHLAGSDAIAAVARRTPVALILFDVLRDGGEDLRSLPLVQRRARLEKIVGNAGSELLRFGEQSAGGGGRRMLAQAEREGWEGLIAKDAESAYTSGKRSPGWRKLKLPCRQEFVVGGWTRPRGSRQHFGALLVGYYGPTPGRETVLLYAGAVGSGFGDAELDRLQALLADRATPTCPFAAVPAPLDRAFWVRPELVVEVKFSEWTDEGLLRHPVYLGRRDDVEPSSVRREPRPLRMAPTSDRAGVETDSRVAMTSPARRRPSVRGAAKAGGRSSAPPRTRSVPATRHLPPDAQLDAVVARLQALEDAKRDGAVALPDGQTVEVTNLTKVFWPGLHITKGELLRYYARVSPWILTAVEDRPLVMKRYPNGISGKTFYQQRAPDEVPPGVRVEWVEDDGEPMPRLVGGSLVTLLYMTQLAAISQDPWFSRIQSRDMADYVALDLDPMPGVPFGQVRDVARLVGEELDRLGVVAVPKTSGSSGLHVYVPLPAETPYDAGQLFCQIVATVVATRHPAAATIERAVAKRGRRVYIDYLQNISGKTLAAVYSARASDFAGVSTPLRWEELEGDVHPEDFTIRSVISRFATVGDLWAPVLGPKRADLRGALEKLMSRY